MSLLLLETAAVLLLAAETATVSVWRFCAFPALKIKPLFPPPARRLLRQTIHRNRLATTSCEFYSEDSTKRTSHMGEYSSRGAESEEALPLAPRPPRRAAAEDAKPPRAAEDAKPPRAARTKINDLNLREWKQYKDILTDSLWLLGERDKSGAHNNAYHGNFIPQIPNQMMRRFTRRGDVVLDAFLGHGTTLIESRKLGRHGVGVELIPQVARVAGENIRSEPARGKDLMSEVVVGDSATPAARKKVEQTLAKIGRESVQLVIMHPPYHDIIKFSDRKEDLCNTETVEEFRSRFGDVVENFSALLDRGRYMAVVIGDKYTGGEWVPLGFHLLNETLARGDGLKLKSIVVKNMVNNRAKRNQESLWRYRALSGGFYIFKHEYILLFKKA
ncbi:MAG: site-specific DNA-methyltransferase [Alphaproteobacteria bacterium]|nr:site-specific DNA-methyltransferase [Alphaproteobacteria bacterium]